MGEIGELTGPEVVYNNTALDVRTREKTIDQMRPYEAATAGNQYSLGAQRRRSRLLQFWASSTCGLTL